MKHLVKIFVVTFLLLINTYALAEQKLVTLDMKYVLNNSKAGKGAQDFLKKSLVDNNKKFSDIENNLKKEETNLLDKKNILSREEYQKKADTLRRKVIDYQSQRRASLDKITNQRTKARQTLLKTIDPILNTYIQENNISIVIDRKYVLGGRTDLDITDSIIKKLNKELQSLNLQ
jgi:outer membrane protein